MDQLVAFIVVWWVALLGWPREVMIWSMRVFRISPVVRGVLVTMVFHTCTAAWRTVYPTSALAMNSSASTCTAHHLRCSMPDPYPWLAI